MPSGSCCLHLTVYFDDHSLSVYMKLPHDFFSNIRTVNHCWNLVFNKAWRRNCSGPVMHLFYFAVEWTLFFLLSWWVDSGTSCSRWQQSTASLRGSPLPDWPFSSVFSTIGGTSNFCIGAVWQWEASSFWSFFISYRCVHRLLRARMCLSESLEACACMHAYTED